MAITGKTLFKDFLANLDEYANAITDLISKCMEDCVPKKTIQNFPNQILWMNCLVYSQMARSAAFKTNDHKQHNKSIIPSYNHQGYPKWSQLESQDNHVDTCQIAWLACQNGLHSEFR